MPLPPLPLPLLLPLPACLALRHAGGRARPQTSLREGCNVILRSDCRQLLARLQNAAKRAVGCVTVVRPGVGGAPAQWFRYNAGQNKLTALPPSDTPSEDALGAPGPGGGGSLQPVGLEGASPAVLGGERLWVGFAPSSLAAARDDPHHFKSASGGPSGAQRRPGGRPGSSVRAPPSSHHTVLPSLFRYALIGNG